MKPWMLALLGLGVALGAVAADTLLLTHSWVRNGYWTYLPVAAGLALAVAAVVKKRSAATIVPAVVALLATAGYSFARFLRTPASPPAVTVGQDFPDFDLPDENGKSVALGSLRRDGPVIVVLFRGHW